MDQEFRRRLFRGAKIEDMILELENLSQLCEEKVKSSDQAERQRFYEGMAIAYTTVALKLKGVFEYIEPKVIDELYHVVEKSPNRLQHTSDSYVEICSFCRRTKEEVGELAVGPGVSICEECLDFGGEVLKANLNKDNG